MQIETAHKNNLHQCFYDKCANYQ